MARTPEQVCARKVPYLSEQCATNAAFLINLRALTEDGRRRVQVPYRCPTCGDWHLSTDRSLALVFV